MTSDSHRSDSRPEVDPGREAERLESLAALLDGDLEADRRAEILASLDGDDLDLLSEVDALLDEVAEVSFDDDDEAEDDQGGEGGLDEPPTSTIPDNVVRGPWSRRAWTTVTAVAAVLALAVVAPRVFLPDPPTPQGLVSELDLGELVIGPAQDLPWSPPRGGSGGGVFSEDGLSRRDSFRLGVLATDFERAARSGDAESLGGFQYLFHQVTGESVLGTMYATLPDASPEEALSLHGEIQELVLLSADPFFYRYGLWVRAAWLAAESGELDFFHGPAPRTLGALEPPDEKLEEEIRLLRERIRGVHGESDLAELADELEATADRHAH